MTGRDPIEFTRRTVTGPDRLERCENYVRVTDDDGEAVGAANPLYTDGIWRLRLEADETANDSDKIIYVPSDEWYHLLWVWVELTTTATVGDRQLVVQIRDASQDVLAEFRAGAVQAASLTRYYLFAPAMADLTDFRDTDYLMTPLPPTMILDEEYEIRVYDNNAVAAAADDMIVQMQVARKSPALT